MALIVQKYGGTSVGNPERIKNVARRVAEYRNRGDQVVVGFRASREVRDPDDERPLQSRRKFSVERYSAVVTIKDGRVTFALEVPAHLGERLEPVRAAAEAGRIVVKPYWGDSR